MDTEDELLCVLASMIIQRKKSKSMLSKGLIAWVTWNSKGSHSIFKFKYNSHKHFRRLCSFGWRLLRSDKTKVFLKHLASSSFEFHAT